jgi:hypothetical protein
VGLGDDVANVDAHTEDKLAVFGFIDRQVADFVLETDDGANGFDGARKFRQKSVAGFLDNAATVLGDCRLDSVRQERRQARMRRLLVIVHEPGITRHVGGQYRRQSASDSP